MQEELCFLPAASLTDRAPEGASLSALGPAANLAKRFLVFANGEARSAAAAAGAGYQVPRGNPGVRQVSGSALEKWPPSQMHVARSSEGSCVPPWWEDNDCAGFYGRKIQEILGGRIGKSEEHIVCTGE